MADSVNTGWVARSRDRDLLWCFVLRQIRHGDASAEFVEA